MESCGGGGGIHLTISNMSVIHGMSTHLLNCFFLIFEGFVTLAPPVFTDLSYHKFCKMLLGNSHQIPAKDTLAGLISEF